VINKPTQDQLISNIEYQHLGDEQLPFHSDDEVLYYIEYV